MIKKLLLILSFVISTTIAFSGTTYAAQEGETIVITEELTKLINLYKEGVITEEEFSKAKSILLNPDSGTTKKEEKKWWQWPDKEMEEKRKAVSLKKQKLTAAERRDLEELEKEELKAAKKAERERKLDEEAEIERACKEDPQSKECRSGASLKRLLKKIKIISSATSIKEKKERELEKQASLEEKERIKAEKAAAKRAEVAAKKAEKKRLKAERKKACSEDPESKACKEKPSEKIKKSLLKIKKKIGWIKKIDYED